MVDEAHDPLLAVWQAPRVLGPGDFHRGSLGRCPGLDDAADGLRRPVRDIEGTQSFPPAWTKATNTETLVFSDGGLPGRAEHAVRDRCAVAAPLGEMLSSGQASQSLYDGTRGRCPR